MSSFETGATRNTDEGKLHYKGFLSPRALRKYAEYMEHHRVQADGSIRDPDNWKKEKSIKTYKAAISDIIRKISQHEMAAQ